MGNKSFSASCVDSKTVLEPYPDPENSPLGPKKARNDQKLSQNQKLELKKT